MPITCRFDAALNVLFVEMRGIISDEELFQYAKQATTDTEIPRVCPELIDLREVRVPQASTASLRRVAETFQDAERAPAGVRIAFVASTDAAYGLARMYQVFRSGSEAAFHVFRKMGRARVAGRAKPNVSRSWASGPICTYRPPVSSGPFTRPAVGGSSWRVGSAAGTLGPGAASPSGSRSSISS